MPRRAAMAKVSVPKALVIANWKMQLGIAETVKTIGVLRAKLKTFGREVEIVLCPSYPSLTAAKELLKPSKMYLGAQDVFWDEKGAYTGEVSPLMLIEAGVSYVIIGHSERRHLLGETDTMIARKVISALSHGLMPVLCVGETAHERNDGNHEMIVRRQLENALRSAPPPPWNRLLYVAYEPVWAIGTGEAADPAVSEDMRQFIYQTLVDIYNDSLVKRSFRILYGGSVDAKNVGRYIGPDRYDGGLVGTASLDPATFVSLVKNVQAQYG